MRVRVRRLGWGLRDVAVCGRDGDVRRARGGVVGVRGGGRGPGCLRGAVTRQPRAARGIVCAVAAVLGLRPRPRGLPVVVMVVVVVVVVARARTAVVLIIVASVITAAVVARVFW